MESYAHFNAFFFITVEDILSSEWGIPTFSAASNLFGGVKRPWITQDSPPKPFEAAEKVA
jgi:hypothetical protein